MEKVLLRRKLVLENGIYIHKWYCTKKILESNPNKGFTLGWNIEMSGEDCDATHPCTQRPGGLTECVSGKCVFIPD